MSLFTNAGDAGVAYSDALVQARDATNALFGSYGFTMPNASGGYDSKAAGAAFDPNTLFSNTTGKVDEDRIKELASQLQIGGQGVLSDISRSGASSEADVAFQSQQSGIEGGGLANQRRSLAEAQTSGQLGSAKMDFLNKLAQAQSPIGGAWQTLQTSNAESAASIAGSTAGINSLTAPDAGIAAVTPPAPTIAPSGAYTTMGKPGGTPPGSPHGGQTYTGPGGVKWQYRINGPSGKGWYK